jgi:PAS domain S-box-containing protein
MPYIGLSWEKRASSARLAAAIATLLGVVTLTGWAFRLPILTSVVPGSLEMKANTAIAVILCGLALLILVDRASKRLERLGQGLALAACVIGLATLAEYLFGWQMGIDELIFSDPAGAFNAIGARMSPFSAVACSAIGFALVAGPYKPLHRATQIATGAAAVIGVVSLLGHLWDAGELITDRWLPPVAINTAACFVLLGGGILLASMRAATSADSPSSSFANVEFKILVGFLFAMSLLLFGGGYTYRTSVEFANSVEWVAHSQEVRATLADVYGSLAGADLAQRGYLLTTEQAQWDEYLRLVEVVKTHLIDLERLVADNPAQLKNLAALRSVVDSRLNDMQSGVVALHSFGFPAARAVLRIGRLTRNTESVRTAVDRMNDVEVRLLARRTQATANIRQTTLISLLITLAVASALFIALFRAIHHEMAARRDAEHALRSSEQYNRSIVDSSPDCLAVLTPDARVSQMTPQGMNLLGVDDFASIANSDWFELWSGEDRAAAHNALAAARDGSAGRFQGRSQTQVGTSKWWDVIVMPIRDADGNTERFLAVSRDITEVKRAESDLRAANRFLDSLIENLPVMIFVKDARSLRYVRQNRATLNLLGLTKEDVIGKLDRDFLPAEQADFILAKDREVLDTGRLVDIPEQSIHTQLLGVRVLHTVKMPILDEQGKPEFLLGFSEDITERKLAEQAIRELNAALLHKASQLESTNKELESFSYSVSHDLRAPLRAIDGFALMIEEDYADTLNAEGRRYLSVIRDNSRRMGELIDDLLSFSRLGRQPLTNHEVNIDALVREVVAEALDAESLSARDKAAPVARIEVDPLPPTRGDRGLLRQVWTNLITNALKYSSKAARPFIQVSGRHVGAETHYSVRDNGVGFNMQYADKLFGVFQRLHRADEFGGTGVGLAIVHRVIARHGGRVWAEGEVDRGAVFSFALPKGDSSE